MAKTKFTLVLAQSKSRRANTAHVCQAALDKKSTLVSSLIYKQWGHVYG